MGLGADAQRIAHAIALASSFAGGHQQNLQGEGMAKALHPGHAADAGILAGIAAAGGVTASLDSLHGDKGFAAATSASSGDWAAALEGLGEWTPIMHMTVKNGVRCSTANAYLRPAMTRPNLTVLSSTLTHRVLLQGTRASGVEISHNGQVRQTPSSAALTKMRCS